MEETFGRQMGLGTGETLSGAMRYSQCSALSFASPGGVGHVVFWGLVTSCCPCRTFSPPLPSALGHMYSFPPVWGPTLGLVSAALRNSFLMYISIINPCIHKNINYLWTYNSFTPFSINLSGWSSWVMDKQKRRWKPPGVKGSSFPKYFLNCFPDRGRTEGEETSYNNY